MRRQVQVATRGRGLVEVTQQVRQCVTNSGVDEGICLCFLRHTSASLVIQENADPSAARDLERWFNKIAPDGDPDHTHTAEGPDDMPSHIRAAITRTSEAFLIAGGQLVIGTWQGLFLFEHRHAPHHRTLEIKIVAG